MSGDQEIRIDDKTKSPYILILIGIIIIIIPIFLFYIFMPIMSSSSYAEFLVSLINEYWWLNLIFGAMCILGLFTTWLGIVGLKGQYVVIDNNSIKFCLTSLLGRMNKVEYQWTNLERIEVHPRNPYTELFVFELWLMYENETKRFPFYGFRKKIIIDILNVIKKLAEEKHIKFISELKLNS